MEAQILSKAELERYSRHLILPEFNIEGQRRLKKAKVLVVGCGGLGAPLLQYLAAAGVGKIGLVDFDVVDASNLQRQVLFGMRDVGRPKVEAAKERLLDLNPHIEIESHNTLLNSENAMEIIGGYDVVADGTDNFQTRYLVNDACVLSGKPNVYASIFRFDGQVSVFNWTNPETGRLGPNYRDLYPSPPPPGQVPSCAEGGVLGVLPGIIGSLQANEVIKVITGIGEPLSGRLFLFDAKTFSTRILKFGRDPQNPLNGENPSQKGLIDYDRFCGVGEEKEQGEKGMLKEITAGEFERLRASGEPYQLIDVREPYEYDIANLGGELMPQGKILDFLEKISKDRKVVVHCRSGKRSSKVIRDLEGMGFTNLLNLRGGLLAYAESIDPSLAKY